MAEETDKKKLAQDAEADLDAILVGETLAPAATQRPPSAPFFVLPREVEQLATEAGMAKRKALDIDPLTARLSDTEKATIARETAKRLETIPPSAFGHTQEQSLLGPLGLKTVPVEPDGPMGETLTERTRRLKSEMSQKLKDRGTVEAMSAAFSDLGEAIYKPPEEIVPAAAGAEAVAAELAKREAAGTVKPWAEKLKSAVTEFQAAAVESPLGVPMGIIEAKTGLPLGWTKDEPIPEGLVPATKEAASRMRELASRAVDPEQRAVDFERSRRTLNQMTEAAIELAKDPDVGELADPEGIAKAVAAKYGVTGLQADLESTLRDMHPLINDLVTWNKAATAFGNLATSPSGLTEIAKDPFAAKAAAAASREANEQAIAELRLVRPVESWSEYIDALKKFDGSEQSGSDLSSLNDAVLRLSYSAVPDIAGLTRPDPGYVRSVYVNNPDLAADGNFAPIAKMIDAGRSDEDLWTVLEKMPLGAMPKQLRDYVAPPSSMSGLMSAARESERAIKKHGGDKFEALERLFESVGTSAKVTEEGGLVVAETPLMNTLKLLGIASTAVTELPVANPFTRVGLEKIATGDVPALNVLQKLGVGPTDQEWRKTLGVSPDWQPLYDRDTSYWTRVLTETAISPEGMLGAPKELRAMGLTEEGSYIDSMLLGIGMGGDLLLPFEEGVALAGLAGLRGVKTASRAASATTSAPFSGAYNRIQHAYTTASGGDGAARVGRQAAETSRSMHQRGQDDWAALNSGTRDGMARTMRAVGVDPDAVLAARREAAATNRMTHLDGLKAELDGSTPEAQALHATPEYQEWLFEAQLAWDEAGLSRADQAKMEALHSWFAFRNALDPELPQFATPEDYFRQMRISGDFATGEAAPAGALFQDEATPTPAAAQVPREPPSAPERTAVLSIKRPPEAPRVAEPTYPEIPDVSEPAGVSQAAAPFPSERVVAARAIPAGREGRTVVAVPAHAGPASAAVRRRVSAIDSQIAGLEAAGPDEFAETIANLKTERAEARAELSSMTEAAVRSVMAGDDVAVVNLVPSFKGHGQASATPEVPPGRQEVEVEREHRGRMIRRKELVEVPAKSIVPAGVTSEEFGATRLERAVAGPDVDEPAMFVEFSGSPDGIQAKLARLADEVGPLTSRVIEEHAAVPDIVSSMGDLDEAQIAALVHVGPDGVERAHTAVIRFPFSRVDEALSGSTIERLRSKFPNAVVRPEKDLIEIHHEAGSAEDFIENIRSFAAYSDGEVKESAGIAAQEAKLLSVGLDPTEAAYHAGRVDLGWQREQIRTHGRADVERSVGQEEGHVPGGGRLAARPADPTVPGVEDRRRPATDDRGRAQAVGSGDAGQGRLQQRPGEGAVPEADPRTTREERPGGYDEGADPADADRTAGRPEPEGTAVIPKRRGPLWHTLGGRVRGAFYRDPQTGRAVIRFFRNGDIRTLLHEQGHFFEDSLGPAWNDRLTSLFDSETTSSGKKRLTTAGKEQFAESMELYLKEHVAPSGFIRKAFDRVVGDLSEIWFTMRREPIAMRDIDPDVRKLFDSWLRPDKIAQKRIEIGRPLQVQRPSIRVSGDKELAMLEGKPEALGKRQEAIRVDLRPKSILQHLSTGVQDGLKRDIKLAAVRGDAEAGRIASERLADIQANGLKSVTPDELFEHALEYVVIDQARKIVDTPLKTLTRRTVIPGARAARVQADINDELAAVGIVPTDLKVIDAGPAGAPEWVVRLTPEQAAQVRGLANRVAVEPMGDLVPDGLLDPRNTLESIPVSDWNDLIESMVDVKAGPGARRGSFEDKIARGAGLALVRDLADLPGVKGLRESRLGEAVKRTFHKEVLAEGRVDPGIREIFEGTMRELSDVHPWVRRAVRDVASGDPKSVRAVLDGLRGMLSEPVPYVLSSSLLDTRRMIAAGSTADDFVNALPIIEGVLAQSGMTSAERAAFGIIRTMANTGDIKAIDDVGKMAVSEAMLTIQTGLDRRLNQIYQRADAIALAMAGSKDKSIIRTLGNEERAALYSYFYSGDWTSMFHYGAERGLEVGLRLSPEDQAQLRKVISDATDAGKSPEQVRDAYRAAASEMRPRASHMDPGTAVVEMIVRLRAQEVIGRLSKKLARHGLMIDVGAEALKSGVALNNVKVMSDAVAYHINNMVGFEWAKQVDRLTGETTYEPKTLRETGHPEAANLTTVEDRIAYDMASRLLNDWGWKIGKGVWSEKVLPDGSAVLMPDIMAEALDEAIEKVSSLGTAWGNLQTTKLGTIELSSVKDPGFDMANAAARMFELTPFTHSRISMGLTTGLGVPNPAYFTGVFLGGAVQAYFGLGMRGAATAIGSNPRQVGAMVARMWKDGDWTPDAPPLITSDGRIYTTDRLAELARENGLKSSFVNNELASRLARDIKRAAPGAWDRMMGRVPLLKGIPDPGEAASAWQRNLTESATAIDNYYRSAIFVDELKKGADPSQAAASARRAALDYGDLAETEAGVLRYAVLFYSYQRRAAALLWHTFLTNPHRIFGLIRFNRHLWNENIDGEPEIVMGEYQHGRIPVGFKNIIDNSLNFSLAPGVRFEGAGEPLLDETTRTQKYAFVMPPMPPSDMLELLVDIYGTAAYDVPELKHMQSAKDHPERMQHAMALANKLTPFIKLPFVKLSGIDPFGGRDVESNDVVPEWFVRGDYNIFDGAFTQYALGGLTPGVNQSGEVKMHANNPTAWWAMRNLVQVPGFGRSMNMITFLDRANAGPVELAVDSSEWVRSHLYGDDKTGIPFFYPPLAEPRPGLGESGKPSLAEAGSVFGLSGQQVLARPEAVQRKLGDQRRRLISELKKEEVELP